MESVRRSTFERVVSTAWRRPFPLTWRFPLLMRIRATSPRLLLTTMIVLATLLLGVLSTAQADDKDRKRAVDKRIAQLKGDFEDTS